MSLPVKASELDWTCGVADVLAAAAAGAGVSVGVRFTVSAPTYAVDPSLLSCAPAADEKRKADARATVRAMSRVRDPRAMPERYHGTVVLRSGTFCPVPLGPAAYPDSESRATVCGSVSSHVWSPAVQVTSG